jgi:hypothetical protein
VTVSLRDSQGKVTFLNAGNTLYNGEACTATAGGNLVCTDATGQDICSMLVDGVGTGDRKDVTPTPTPTPTPTLEERQGP